MHRPSLFTRLLVVPVLIGLALGSVAAMAQETDTAGEEAAPGGPCGDEPISIARMQWPSSVILAHVHALLLQQELGCEVQVVGGDLAATASSMATTGQPAIAPEMWPTRIAQIWNSAIESGRVRPAGSSFEGGPLEQWFVPAHMAERFPDLSTAAGLDAVLDQLAEAGEQLTFISCPPDWACSVINRNLLRTHGLLDRVELVEPANRFELDTLIAQTVSRRDLAVFYYWQPNSVLAQFDFTPLDMGSFDADAFDCLARRDCADPQPSAFVSETVFIAISAWLAEDVPLVSDYLLRAAMPLGELNALLAWQAENGTSHERAAAHFVETRADIWQPWVETQSP